MHVRSLPIPNPTPCAHVVHSSLLIAYQSGVWLQSCFVTWWWVSPLGGSPCNSCTELLGPLDLPHCKGKQLLELSSKSKYSNCLDCLHMLISSFITLKSGHQIMSNFVICMMAVLAGMSVVAIVPQIFEPVLYLIMTQLSTGQQMKRMRIKNFVTHTSYIIAILCMHNRQHKKQ